MSEMIFYFILSTPLSSISDFLGAEGAEGEKDKGKYIEFHFKYRVSPNLLMYIKAET